MNFEDEAPKATFNKVAERKPFREPQFTDKTKEVLFQKEKDRLDLRCERCGTIKQQRKDGPGKFRLVCTKCKTDKRRHTAAMRRGHL